jgi:Leucine-rich repeat (LRR) protein
MNNNHFSGRLPPDIGSIPNLDELWIGDNKFTGAVPSEIGLMTNLKILSIKHNSFSGAIPSEVQNLGLLETLDLSGQNGNQFDGPLPAFDKNPKLKTVDASANAFSGRLPKSFLGEVDSAEQIKVNLTKNAFVGGIPEQWSRFESLDIDLSNNQLTEMSPALCGQNDWNGGRVGLLGTCDAILCPPGTHLAGSGRQIEPLKSCEPCEGGEKTAPFYGLHDCLDPKLVAERDILTTFYQASNGTSWLSQTNWLSTKSVCIWYGIICNENGFIDTIQLEDNFVVSGSEMIAEASQILLLTELTTLDLKGNDVILDFNVIQRDATKLEFLRLSGAGLSTLEGISNAVNLKALHVTNNQIKNIPDELYSMDQLESIFLSFNMIAGTISPEVGQLTNLKELYLFGNLLTGKIPTQVGLMTSLTDFVISNNFLSGFLPDQLSFLPKLEQLSVYNQQGLELLTGPVPSFSGAPNLW